MTTNFNIEPYFDDFDSGKNFNKILFKPSFPVQARELTQSQSILQSQIKSFGDHVFKHGSVVIPGNSFADLNVTYIRIRVQPTLVNLSGLENQTLIGQNGVRARIRRATIINSQTVFLIGYISGGTDGRNSFNANETLTVPNTGLSFVTALENHTGTVSMAFINSGVFYINGRFVEVEKQSVIISDLDLPASCQVVLRVAEDIVTSDEDQSLLDPARGTNNFTAPGADRFRVRLFLESLPLNGVLSANYVELMRFERGVLKKHLRHTQYSELEKNLARRTFDESGDYVVGGLRTRVNEHLRSTINGGVHFPPIGNRGKMVVQVGPGKAYIQGFEVESLHNTQIDINKARTPDHIKVRNNTTMQPRFGQYLFVSNFRSLPQLNVLTTVTLWDSPDPGNPTAVQIGTARVMAIDHLEGDPESQTGVFKLYFINLNLNQSNMNSIAGIRFTGGSMTVLHRLSVTSVSNVNFTQGEVINGSAGQSATVIRWNRATASLYVSRHSRAAQIPTRGSVITGATSTATGIASAIESSVTNEGSASILRLPVNNVHSVTNEQGVPDISYKSYRELLIVTNATGNGSVTISGNTIDPLEAGNVLAVTPNGILSNSLLRLDPSGTVLSITGGPINTTVRVIVSVTKNNVVARVKTLTSRTFTVSAPTSRINLGKADIFRIVSIIDTTGDITNRYRLDNGQRDYFYDLGSVILTSARTPVGVVTITFEYFEHTGAGDFFTIDSYRQTLPDITEIRSYTSETNRTTHDLKNSIDFRPRIGDDGTFSHGTARPIDLVQINSRVTTSARFYVPRIDLVYMNKNGVVEVATGIPDEVPSEPRIPGSSILLASISIPAFTPHVRRVRITQARNRGYTMADIARVENRVENLEQFALLSSAESNMINHEVLDAETGLTRFKSGYLVENFSNPSAIADTTNPDFSVTFFGGILPRTEANNTHLTIDTTTSSNYVATGNVVSLPYTEVVFASQLLSTRVTNVNPFAVFSWIGNMVLRPRTDNWTDTEILPEIEENVTNTEVITVIRPPVTPPPKPPPPPPPMPPPPQAVITPAPAPAPISVPPPPAPPPPVVVVQEPIPFVPPPQAVITPAPAPAPISVPSPPSPPPVIDPCGGGDGGDGTHGGGGDVGGGVSGVGSGDW